MSPASLLPLYHHGFHDVLCENDVPVENCCLLPLEL
jgi:hypothetical protein